MPLLHVPPRSMVVASIFPLVSRPRSLPAVAPLARAIAACSTRLVVVVCASVVLDWRARRWECICGDAPLPGPFGPGGGAQELRWRPSASQPEHFAMPRTCTPNVWLTPSARARHEVRGDLDLNRCGLRPRLVPRSTIDGLTRALVDRPPSTWARSSGLVDRRRRRICRPDSKLRPEEALAAN